MKGFMLAGVSSNVGKTTVTMGILSALKQRGFDVVPFKSGPDYIDPMFHEFVTGTPSSNLDSWMIEKGYLRTIMAGRMEEKKNGIAVVEGAMGLFDGHASGGEEGSAAYLAKTLGFPVILVIDGRGMSTSAAALVKGYAEFDPELNVAGVIINRLKSASHYLLLKKAIESRTGIPCVGWMPENENLALGSRHLGLIPADEIKGLKKKVALAAEFAETYIDLDKILSLSEVTLPGGITDPFAFRADAYKDLTIAYAWDNAFNFYYTDTLGALKKLGVRLIPFSPLNNTELPDDIDALYLGGGFPEVFGEAFEKNTMIRESIRNSLNAGLPCYAECGGLMVLTNYLEDKEGNRYEGVGFLEAETIMTERLQRFGYVTVEADIHGDHYQFRAHEFHHSRTILDDGIPRLFTVTKGKRNWTCGYTKASTIAGYPHFHAYSSPEWVFFLLDRVRKIKEEKGR